MTRDLLSSKNRLIYGPSQSQDSFPMGVKDGSVLSLFPHERSHAVGFRVELLLVENGNVGILYVSKRNGDGILHCIMCPLPRACSPRAATSSRAGPPGDR